MYYIIRYYTCVSTLCPDDDNIRSSLADKFRRCVMRFSGDNDVITTEY